MALNPFQGVRQAAGMKIVYWGNRRRGRRGQVGRDWNVRTRARSLQELEQVERCRRLLTGGSELPRVSGAGARTGTGAGPGRLASVSKAASSQEPEPGPEEGETKIPNGKLSNLGLFSPNQYNLLPTRMPPPFHPDPLPSAPHHHWPLAPAPPLHSRAADLLSPPQGAGPLQPQGEGRDQARRSCKGQLRTCGEGRRASCGTVPAPGGSSGLSPSSVMSDSWVGSSWPWGPVPPKWVEGGVGLTRLLPGSGAKLTSSLSSAPRLRREGLKLCTG